MFLWAFLCFVFSLIVPEISGTTATFKGSGKLTQSDVRSVGSHEDFTTIVVGSGITSIENYSFYECKNFRTLKLSDTVQTIRGNAFFRNPRLMEFEVDPNNIYLASIPNAILDKKMEKLFKVSPAVSSFTIPNTVNFIDDRCFTSSQINELEIPSKVEYIGAGCFNEVSMQKITFAPGSQLKIIFSESFWWKTALEVHIPPSVETIKNASFHEGQSLNIIFDDIENSKLTTIEELAFGAFHGTSIKFPPLVKELPNSVLINSLNLEEVNIPRMCTKINVTAFQGCTKLRTITIDDGNQNFIYHNGSLYDSQKTVMYLAATEGDYLEIPPTVGVIASSVLQSRSQLKYLKVENNEKYSAFDNILYNKNYEHLIAVCGGVTSATIHQNTIYINPSAAQGVSLELFNCGQSKSLLQILNSAFRNCKSLKSFTMPSSLNFIDGYAFYQCTSLTTVTFVDGIKIYKINDFAFQSCTSLQTFDLPDSVEFLGRGVFTSCNNLEQCSPSSNSTLKQIYDAVFSSCFHLKSFLIPPELNYIGYTCFQSCYEVEIDFSQASSLATIQYSAFAYCRALKTVTIGSSVTNLQYTAFRGCTNLETVTFASDINLEKLDTGLFQECIKLKSLQIPASVSSIDPSIIFKCVSLKSLTVHPLNKKYYDSNNVIYERENSALVVCSAGIPSADISDKVKEIKGNAFYGCETLQNISFGENCQVEVIKENTFGLCTSLTKVEFPKSIQRLEANSFFGCSNLEVVSFAEGSNLLSIGEGTFSGCTSLRTVSFGPSSKLETIDPKAFSGCTKLSSFTFPTQLTSIGSLAFENTAIKTIGFIGDGYIIKSFSTNAFSSMPSLESFNFPASIISFEERLFQNCPQLSVIAFPSNSECKELPPKAFQNVSSLTTITLPEGIEKIGESSLEGLPSLSLITNFDKVTEISSKGFSRSTLSKIKLPNILTLDESAFEESTFDSITLGEKLQIIPSKCFAKSTFSFFIAPNITEIGIGAFRSAFFSHIEISESCNLISDFAFADNSKIEKITIKSKNIEIQDSVFSGCAKLETIKFCGRRATTSEVGPPPRASANVPYFFDGASFCGLHTQRVLGDQCEMLASVVEAPRYTEPAVSSLLLTYVVSSE